MVDAWREERQSEIQGVANATESLDKSDVKLPEWATAPSANRGAEEDETPVEIEDVEVEPENDPVPDP